jgi:hypothetical protein
MATFNAETDGSAGPVDTDPAPFVDDGDSVNALAVASVVLSGLGFLTLLRLADRRDRTPAKALGLFFATSLESIGGTVLGFVGARRASESEQRGKGFLLGASGAVLGIVTTLLNLNWMRTRRRL